MILGKARLESAFFEALLLGQQQRPCYCTAGVTTTHQTEIHFLTHEQEDLCVTGWGEEITMAFPVYDTVAAIVAAAMLAALGLPAIVNTAFSPKNKPVCEGNRNLKTLFERDLNQLHREVAAYQTRHARWCTAPGICNPAGNLCLHLLGNLNTYIGAEMGHTGIFRSRRPVRMAGARRQLERAREGAEK